MTKSQRLKPVVQVAEVRERDAAQRMAQSQRAAEQAKAKLDELVRYRDEYSQRFDAAGLKGMEAAQMHDYRSFLARINEAIVYQQGLYAQAMQSYAQQRQAWTALRTHSKALDKVVERYQQQEQRAQDRREQNELDERAQYHGEHRAGHSDD